MEFPTASAHRGLVPWLGLLLAVFPSSLTTWIPPTTAQFAIVSTFAAEGQDVILRVRNSHPDVLGFMWYRGIQMKHSNFIGYIALGPGDYVPGPGNTGREPALDDGSLMIRNVTPSDEGIYMVVALLPNFQRARGYGSLTVYGPVSVPTLLASSTRAIENEDFVVMTCQTNASSTNWLFNGRSLWLRERMTLSPDDRTLTIDPVRREDAGKYQCKVSNPFSSMKSAPVKLCVKY